jgi:hypothetical protein
VEQADEVFFAAVPRSEALAVLIALAEDPA